MKLIFKEAQNLDIVAAILNSTRQPGRVFETSFHQIVQMASDKPFNNQLGLWLLISSLFWAKHAPNSEMKALKWIIAWKNTFCWPWEGYQVFSSLQVRVGRNDVKQTRPDYQDRLKMAASEVTSFETNFFRIAGTSEAWTSANGKAEWLLAIGEDQIKKLFVVTFFEPITSFPVLFQGTRTLYQ